MPWHISWGDAFRDPSAPTWLDRRRKSFYGFAFPFGLPLERSLVEDRGGDATSL